MTYRFESHWSPDGLQVRDRQTGEIRTVGPGEPGGEAERATVEAGPLPPPWSVDALGGPSGRLAGSLEALPVGLQRLAGWLLAPDPGLWSAAARRRAVGTTALALVGLFTLVVAPLLLRRGQVLVSHLYGPPLRRIWHTTQAAAAWPATPTDGAPFGWPEPVALASASGVEVWLSAPALLGQDWTAGWGQVQAWTLAVNVLGVLALAGAGGARGAGLFVAGALTLLCQPLWADLYAVELAASWPGLACGALACVVALLRGRLRGLGVLVGGTVGVGLGWAAWQVHPANVGLLAPVAAGLAMAPGRRAWRASNLGIALGAAALFGFALDGFALIADAAACRVTGCTTLVARVAGAQLLSGGSGLAVPAVGLAGWVLLPVVLLTARRLPLGLGCLGVGVLAVGSLGLCPSATVAGLDAAEPVEALRPLACVLDGATRPRTVLVAAALGAAALGGAALGALPWPRLRWFLGLPVVAMAAVSLLPSVWADDAWQRPERSRVAAFLEEATPGPAAELPYDRMGQLRSALDHPERPRRNPARLDAIEPSADAALRWIDALGAGQPLPEPAPTAAMIAATGLKWVILEPGRCGQHGTHCTHAYFLVIGEVLGAPQLHADGEVVAWAVTATPDLTMLPEPSAAPSKAHVEAPPGAPGGAVGDAPAHRPGPEPGAGHAVAPPGADGGAAPGFALDIRIPGGLGADLTAHVAERSFAPNDRGDGEDLRAGDGVWTALIERYPPQRPLEIRLAGEVVFSGPIALETGSGIPRMAVEVVP